MIPPNIALLDEQIQELSIQLRMANDDYSWFKKRDIEVARIDGFWLLRQTENGTLNHWNMLCNGLIFNTNGILVSFPPIKLYSLNDQGVLVNLKECHLVEKIGGQMICVCFPSGKVSFPAIHTIKTISGYVTCNNYIYSDELRDVARRIINIDFPANGSYYTYTFQWKNNELYLVHARYLPSKYENTEIELDSLALSLKVKRAWHVDYVGWGSVHKTKSGKILVRDAYTGERANVDLVIHRPKLVATGRFKHLIPYWATGKHEQVILQFPQTKRKYVQLDKAVFDRKFSIRLVTNRWLNMGKSAVAQLLRTSAVPTWMHKFVLRLHGLPKDKWDETIVAGFKKMSAKQLIKILCLTDETASEAVEAAQRREDAGISRIPVGGN